MRHNIIIGGLVLIIIGLVYVYIRQTTYKTILCEPCSQTLVTLAKNGDQEAHQTLLKIMKDNVKENLEMDVRLKGPLKVFTIIACIVIVIAAIGVGFFYWKKRTEAKEPVNQLEVQYVIGDEKTDVEEAKETPHDLYEINFIENEGNGLRLWYDYYTMLNNPTTRLIWKNFVEKYPAPNDDGFIQVFLDTIIELNRSGTEIYNQPLTTKPTQTIIKAELMQLIMSTNPINPIVPTAYEGKKDEFKKYANENAQKEFFRKAGKLEGSSITLDEMYKLL